MSFRINHNTSSINAHRNAARAETSVNMSIKRLTSGLRINSITEDPSGLLTSDSLRTRIGAMEAATRNVQDTLNMTKLGDAAYGEVSQQLTALRALAISAGNTATISPTQLRTMQEEFKSGLDRIDRVASSTTWGTKKLLDGSAGSTTTVVAGGLVHRSVFGGTSFNQPIQSGMITMTQTVMATRALNQGNQVYISTSSILPAGKLMVNGVAFASDGVTTDLNALVAQINNRSLETNVTAETRPNAAGGDYIALVSRDYGSKGVINLTDPSGVISSSPSATLVTGVDAQATVDVTTATGVQTITFAGGRGQEKDGLLLSDTDGNLIHLNAIGNNAFVLPTPTHVANFSRGNSVRNQSGDGSYDVDLVTLGDVRSDQIGLGSVPGRTLRDLDLGAAGGPTDALNLIDAALNEVNRSRASLGSVAKNTLESLTRTNAETSEGLQNRNSSIIDIDMAAEMTEYTKQQVIQQAALSILGQSNQQSNQVLSLLQS